MNCVLVTQGRGMLIARNVHEILRRSYGPGHTYLPWAEDPGVVGLVCKRTARGFDVIDHVLERTTAADRGRG